jgi:Malic enzyme, N-terminal domain
LGLREPRLEGDEYLAMVDEFMEAVFARWPKAVVQVYLSCKLKNFLDNNPYSLLFLN